MKEKRITRQEACKLLGLSKQGYGHHLDSGRIIENPKGEFEVNTINLSVIKELLSLVKKSYEMKHLYIGLGYLNKRLKLDKKYESKKFKSYHGHWMIKKMDLTLEDRKIMKDYEPTK